ncbi:MAG: isochorismatase family protein [Proteobacteria bacterium]|nr:isochorismatase family protein [Pseudomonadota bacterium]
MIPCYEDCALLIIDMQEKLLNVLDENIREQCLKNTEILIELIKDVNGSIFYTEQYPNGLGPTHPRLKEKLEGALRVEKIAFSCLGEPDFCQKVLPHIPQTLIIAGLEAHICVFMTIVDLIAEDEDEALEIFVPIDAVASRKKLHWKNAIQQMADIGVYTTNTETLVYQAIEEAKNDTFKKYSALLR